MTQIRTLPHCIKMCMTIGNLPSSYMSSLSYEEQLLWFCKFLENEVIPVVNNNSEVVKELKNIIENLDLQNEVNNKLDAMAQSGQLSDIIAQYLQLAGVLAYNTKNEMKIANNLVNGSIAKTLGENEYKDGKGCYYKIRQITSDDNIDDENIIALNVSNLIIAEKIPYSNNYELNNSILEKGRGNHIVVFGDSWTDENVSIGFDGIGWCKALENKTGLIVHNYAINGSAFGNGMFETQVRTFLADNTFDHKLVDKIIFMGGINDYHLNLTGVQTANNLLSLLSLLATDTNLKISCQKYFINNWSFVNGTYTDPTTQITSNDTIEEQMNWYHDLFSNIQSNPNMRIICIDTFDWYPYSAWNETFYHVTETYKTLYQWNQIYSAVYGGEIKKAPYLMKINAPFGNVVYKVNKLHSITCECNVWSNSTNYDLTFSHKVPYQIDLMKTSNGSVISLVNNTLSFVNTGVNQIGYGKFTKYTSYSDVINGKVDAN